uniref:Uncharacterized protein n=1 Tax=Ditylenchus dipsaci TaxID=166011 RepID=A0A915DR58_9BILA
MGVHPDKARYPSETYWRKQWTGRKEDGSSRAEIKLGGQEDESLLRLVTGSLVDEPTLGLRIVMAVHHKKEERRDHSRISFSYVL